MKRGHMLISCLLLFIAAMSASVANSGVAAMTVGRAAIAARKGDSVQLKSIEPLKEAFQRDAGKIRLVTILSPT